MIEFKSDALRNRYLELLLKLKSGDRWTPLAAMCHYGANQELIKNVLESLSNSKCVQLFHLTSVHMEEIAF
ncbi:MAG: hypothetical protein LBI69_04595 [Puniceicoccales bacterium]|jgi:hypothetical protein|nr:hypothetical protein [Puniceicoccales bacterium]